MKAAEAITVAVTLLLSSVAAAGAGSRPQEALVFAVLAVAWAILSMGVK